MCGRFLPSFLGSDLLHPKSLWRDARVAELLVQPGRVARREAPPTQPRELRVALQRLQEPLRATSSCAPGSRPGATYLRCRKRSMRARRSALRPWLSGEAVGSGVKRGLRGWGGDEYPAA